MAANKSVTVLAPNGRRQTVKITPNTTILQILEEVCQKHGYSPQKWDIKHFNQVLDASSIIRFTGLPNNASLEMSPRSTERATSLVTIGIQLENGERLMGDFSPDTTLIKIIQSLCPKEEADNTVITYMHQEVHGKDKLEEMTLQSLGLNNGRAMLRLLHRDLTKLNTQAHVGGKMTAKPSKSNEKSGKNSKKVSNMAQNVTSQIKKALDPIATIVAEKANDRNKNFPKGGGCKLGEGTSAGSAQVKPSSSAKENKQDNVPIIKEKAAKEEAMECSEETEECIPVEVEDPINYLGERNALIFNQAGAKAVPPEDLPDNFFDLTVDDAKALLRDAKRQREEFEESPLTTSAQREMKKTVSTLNKLHKYRKTIIRIQFPNQMVFQAMFTPLETVEIVKDVVKVYLANPDEHFDLYVTPPKKILNPQNRLIDESLVPSAIIYYSGNSDLKPEFKTKLIDPKVASVQAIKSRMAMTRDDPSSNPGINSAESSSSIEPSPGSSGIGNAIQENANKIKNYTPKWFKRAFQ